MAMAIGIDCGITICGIVIDCGITIWGMGTIDCGIVIGFSCNSGGNSSDTC